MAPVLTYHAWDEMGGASVGSIRQCLGPGARCDFLPVFSRLHGISMHSPDVRLAHAANTLLRAQKATSCWELMNQVTWGGSCDRGRVSFFRGLFYRPIVQAPAFV